MTTVQDRLEYLRGELRAERISYAELAELQDLAPQIADDDVELLEAAGVPEFAADELKRLRLQLAALQECRDFVESFAARPPMPCSYCDRDQGRSRCGYCGGRGKIGEDLTPNAIRANEILDKLEQAERAE